MPNATLMSQDDRFSSPGRPLSSGSSAGIDSRMADLVLAAPAISSDTLCAEVSSIFAANESFPCLGVTGENHAIVGMLSRHTYLNIMAKPLMTDLYAKRPVETIMRVNPLVVDARELIEIAADSLVKTAPEAMFEGFLIADGSRYLGVGRAQDLLALSAAKARRAAEENHQKSERIAALLDNSGQGFLSFGTDLIVEADCSRACLVMLGHSPCGQDIVPILAAGDPDKIPVIRRALRRIVTESDPLRKEMYLGLLPARLLQDDRVIDLRYLPISAERIMLVMTDVTDKMALEDTIERERARLELIVKAAGDSREFFQAVDEFKRFLDAIDAISRPERAAILDVDELYRQIHTFKGTFGQFGFFDLPKALHSLESAITHIRDEDTDLGTMKHRLFEAVCDGKLGFCLKKDLRIIIDVFGDEFVSHHGVFQLPAVTGQKLQSLAEDILHQDGLPRLTEESRAVLQQVVALRNTSLRQSLEHYGSLVARVAQRQNKKVERLAITGDDTEVDAEAFGPFVRSLGHLFRNAVAHGIEAPEDRQEAGKAEAGRITCRLQQTDSQAIIEISDDGQGIDEQRLAAKAAERLGAEPAAALSRDQLLEMIFADGLSTRQTADEIAGRGVGLSAVRAEVQALGGSITVASTPGQGTRFTITLPRQPEGKNIPA